MHKAQELHGTFLKVIQQSPCDAIDVSPTSVFFNLFAAAKPSANVCTARGTYAMMQVFVLLSVTNNFVPVNFGLFRRYPWQSLAEP